MGKAISIARDGGKVNILVNNTGMAISTMFVPALYAALGEYMAEQNIGRAPTLVSEAPAPAVLPDVVALNVEDADGVAHTQYVRLNTVMMVEVFTDCISVALPNRTLYVRNDAAAAPLRRAFGIPEPVR